jgi:hypothetical protein
MSQRVRALDYVISGIQGMYTIRYTCKIFYIIYSTIFMCIRYDIQYGIYALFAIHVRYSILSTILCVCV